MITNENWIDFIQKFFGASGTTEWIAHVAGGWNHVKGEAGCGCSFTWYSGPVECENYQSIQAAKLEFADVVVENDSAPVDAEGVAEYLQRDDDTVVSNFFEEEEEEEPVAETNETKVIEKIEEEEPSHAEGD
jgi:hypothetical protein